MKWIPWDKSVDVPFDAAQAVYQATSGTMDSKMVGNGEHLFAAHTTGSVSTDDRFDVLGTGGERYEVKTLGNFRFNYDQTPVKIVYDRFMSIASEMTVALSGTSYDRFYSRSLDISSKPYIGVKKAIGKYYANGREPDIGLEQMVKVLCFDKITKGDTDTVSIDLGADYFDVSMPQLVKISDIVGMDIEYMEINEIDKVYSKLDDECFTKPYLVSDTWKSIKPSETLLTHSDHLVIVHKELGYIILDNEEIDNYVVFTGFSKGEAHFRTTKELKDVPIEVMECNTASRQLDFTKWFGDLDKEEQVNPFRCCNWTSF